MQMQAYVNILLPPIFISMTAYYTFFVLDLNLSLYQKVFPHPLFPD